MKRYISLIVIAITLFLVGEWVKADAQNKETTGALTFQVNYLYRSAGAGELKPINDGDVLRSGDHYKIIFTPDVDCYVYIFQVDSANNIFQLFPMETFKGVTLGNTNPVVKGKKFILPSPRKAFQLDNTVGQERIYFIASKKRDTRLEQLYANISKTSRSTISPAKDYQTPIPKLPDSDQLESAQAKLEKYFTQRGLNVVSNPEPANISWERGGDMFSIMGQKLEYLCEDCIHVIEFIHR